MNGSWGFNITDSRFKSHRELVSYVVRAAGNGGNLLLNVGPRPDGTIQPEATSRLRDLGAWMSMYGATLYGTRAGPVPPRSWGATTRRGDTVFVHVLDWPDRVLSLPPIDGTIARATMFRDGSGVAFTQTATGVSLTIPDAQRDELDRVVVLVSRRRGQ
jgi:alpha-L-fucosidase